MNTQVVMPKNEESFLPLGRVVPTDEGLVIDYSAAGFSIRFRGAGICLHFAPYHDEQSAYIRTILDGEAVKHEFADGAPIRLSCAEGEHTLTFIRLTEGGCPIVLTFAEILSDGEPALLPAPTDERPRAVFFGDSITCGYGNIGTTEAFLTCEEDATLSYACLAADAIGYRPELVAISGHGIAQNYDGDADDLIPYVSERRSRTVFEPYPYPDDAALVVVNLSTNDEWSATPVDKEIAAASAFFDSLIERYPQAQIVFCYGAMARGYLEPMRRLIAEKAHPRLHFCTIDRMISPSEGEIGGNGHPNVKGQRRIADELVAFLRENRLV